MGTGFASPSSVRDPGGTPNRDHRISSTFTKTVCLQDWWLIRSDTEFQGKRLGVGGLTAERPMRLFFSAPIVKRHDLFTLETADGITVLIKGSVNRSRMQENGFNSEVCSHFLVGIPYYWEDFSSQCMQKETTHGELTPSSSHISNTTNICKPNNSEVREHSAQRGEFEKSKPISGEVSKDLLMSSKEKAISSLDANQCTTDGFLHEDIGAKRKILVNTCKGLAVDSSLEKMSVQNSVILQEGSSLTNLNLKNASSSVFDKDTGKPSTTRLRSPKRIEGFGDRMKAISNSIRTANVSSFVRENSVYDLVGKKIDAGDKVGLSNINLGEGAEKFNLGSPIDNSTKCLADAELRNGSADGCDGSALKASPKAGDSCVNDVSTPMLNAPVPTKASVHYLESSSKDLGGSKSHEGCKQNDYIDGTRDPSASTNSAQFVACSSKSSTDNAVMSVNASLDMENKGGTNLSSECVVNNENGDPAITLQAAEDPAARHEAGRSPFYERKNEKARKVMSSSECRRSNRLKGLKNIKDTESEKNNVHAVLLDSNSVESSVGIVNGRKLDFSCTKPEATKSESSLGGENVGSQHGRQIDSLSFSTPTDSDVALNQNFESNMNAIESREPTEHCSPSAQLDTSGKTDLKISEEGAESPNTQQGMSGKRTKRKLEYVTRYDKNVTTPVSTRSIRKNIKSVSAESLSYKRSRSGRLLVPPLEFWRNEQAVYDRDGQITGIIPTINSGCKTEILQKKKKLG